MRFYTSKVGPRYDLGAAPFGAARRGASHCIWGPLGPQGHGTAAGGPGGDDACLSEAERLIYTSPSGTSTEV